MWQGLPEQGEKEEYGYQWQCNENQQSGGGSWQVRLPFKECCHSYNGKDEIDRIVVKELPANFSEKGVEINTSLKEANPATMEGKAYEITLHIPKNNRKEEYP
jgi:hypothetical protein